MRPYDRAHRRLRRAIAPTVNAGLANCARCHQPIKAGSKWHLGHLDGTPLYQGPEHVRCNCATAGRTRRRTSRIW